MGNISIVSLGNGKGRLQYTCSTSRAVTMPWRYGELSIVADGRPAARVLPSGGTFTGPKDPATLIFDAQIRLGWFANCALCSWKSPITYSIMYVYDPPNTGAGVFDAQYMLIERGTVSMSGPLPCSDCDGGGDDDGDDGGDGDAGGGGDAGDANPYGPATPSEVPNEPSPPSSSPCLPPQPSQPVTTVPTPCSGSSGGNGGPNGFSGS